ncbi:uncharacterized protein LOC130429904 [Triplophysa dalaica]|uniref:uncharacterized protein LOC130429904 n=1 Tax=Triplophysa dalaica TaxID=1582913 RepID=UPI0024DF7F11|nr:uncharacterized protein LOC130429904 [Triplophysa dalaica]
MTSPAAVFPILFAVLFEATSANDACQFHTTSSGVQKPFDFCGIPVSWDGSRFCCGTCDDRYCCADPQKKLSSEAQRACLRKLFDNLRIRPSTGADDVTIIAIMVPIIGLVFLSVLFIVCWVHPRCILYKKCRNLTRATIGTVVTTHFLPHQTVINGGQYPTHQMLPNNPEYGGQPVPTGPYQGQRCLPPPYQQAGAGYPIPYTQPPYICEQYPVHPPAPSGVAQNQVPRDYKPIPAFNPVYVGSSKTGYSDDCLSYTTSGGSYNPSKSCSYGFCCGTCEHRYCCPFEANRFSESAQLTCSVRSYVSGSEPLSTTGIVFTIAGIAIVFIAIITCCCCCCSCCQSQRPMVGTTTTTVVNTQCNMQQPMVQGGQYPAYQPVPTQPAYAGQPMQAGQYQTQPYVAGPPPPYHTVAGPGQPPYLMHTAAQEGYANQPQTDAFNQPAYNPSYMQTPNCGY